MNNLDLGLEKLEDRRMMAGDVSVDVVGGDLRITGDAQGNEIAVRASSESPDSFVVEGLNGTRINGQAGSEFFDGVIDDVRINMRNGDNLVLLTTRQVDAGGTANFGISDVTVRTGNGSDLVVVVGNDFQVNDDFRLNTGAGDDAVFFEDGHVTDQLRINTGSGSDWLEFNRATVEGRTMVNSGSGEDTLSLTNTEFGERAVFNMGGGSDELLSHGLVVSGDARLRGGGGDDRWTDSQTGASQFLAGGSIGGFEAEELVTRSELNDLLDTLEAGYERAEDRQGLV